MWEDIGSSRLVLEVWLIIYFKNNSYFKATQILIISVEDTTSFLDVLLITTFIGIINILCVHYIIQFFVRVIIIS